MFFGYFVSLECQKTPRRSVEVRLSVVSKSLDVGKRSWQHDKAAFRIHSSKLTWKWRGAPYTTTIFYIGPLLSFHVNLGEGTWTSKMPKILAQYPQNDRYKVHDFVQFGASGMRVHIWGPEGRSTQYSRTLVPNTIKSMVFGTREVLGPSGGVTDQRIGVAAQGGKKPCHSCSLYLNLQSTKHNGP